jgi:2-polyprenyl-3-methyl-5-hydroxy-6-metoxy-1,4-benzoquinol methylase
MLRSWLEDFRDPVTQSRLELKDVEEQDGRIVRGALLGGHRAYPIVDGIPRLCPTSNYADSFSFQWNTYAKTQLDSRGKWSEQSSLRLFQDSGWSRDLEGERVLEAGSGMGRFTEVLAKTGARIASFDYSRGVEANFANNKKYENVSFAQADIYAPPYAPLSFDKVLCIGVLQNTPSPRKGFKSLLGLLRPGGHIVIDTYRLEWKSLLRGKYYVRPITRHMSPETLHRAIQLHISWVFPLTGALHRLIGPRARSLSWALAMADYRGVFPVDDTTARELSLLDTMDQLAPRYDRPATLGMVRRWFEAEGLEDIVVRPGSNGIVASGYKPGPRESRRTAAR